MRSRSCVAEQGSLPAIALNPLAPAAPAARPISSKGIRASWTAPCWIAVFRTTPGGGCCRSWRGAWLRRVGLPRGVCAAVPPDRSRYCCRDSAGVARRIFARDRYAGEERVCRWCWPGMLMKLDTKGTALCSNRGERSIAVDTESGRMERMSGVDGAGYWLYEILDSRRMT